MNIKLKNLSDNIVDY